MQVASNSLQHLLQFYHQQLDPILGADEATSIFYEACTQLLGRSKAELNKDLHYRLQQSELLVLYDQAKAVANGMPLQYVTGKAFFYDSEFEVTPAVLIPRPETEELVHHILNYRSYESVLDIGTGSGCIAIELSKHLPEAGVTAIDVSREALEIAIKNNSRLNTCVVFHLTDILDSKQSEQLTRYDCIVSNPPYIAEAEKNTLAPHVIDFEPHLALFSGQDPLLFYKRIIDYCEQHLEQNGSLWFELNPLTAEAVLDYANASHIFERITLIKDITNKDRILHAIKK